MIYKCYAYTASNFKRMRGLDASMVATGFHGVIAKEMSILEMMNECTEIKKVQIQEIQEVSVNRSCTLGWGRDRDPIFHYSRGFE